MGRDGVRLAANLFMPTGANPSEKFPVLLEYLPYRKDDGTATRDYAIRSYFVRSGYVGARVDIRGTGQSESQTPDREYSKQELQDGMEIIAWLARQPWSNGNIRMFGISWSVIGIGEKYHFPRACIKRELSFPAFESITL